MQPTPNGFEEPDEAQRVANRDGTPYTSMSAAKIASLPMMSELLLGHCRPSIHQHVGCQNCIPTKDVKTNVGPLPAPSQATASTTVKDLHRKGSTVIVFFGNVTSFGPATQSSLY
jgi:hypothetical protein